MLYLLTVVGYKCSVLQHTIIYPVARGVRDVTARGNESFCHTSYENHNYKHYML